MMRPGTEHVDRILGEWWRAGDEMEGLPADLTRRADALDAIVVRVNLAAEAGKQAAAALIEHGEGELADAIIATWTRHFAADFPAATAQVAAAAATLHAWAPLVGQLTMNWAGVVWEAEELITEVRAAAAAIGADPQPAIDSLIAQGHAQVAAYGTAAMGAIAAAMPAALAAAAPNVPTAGLAAGGGATAAIQPSATTAPAAADLTTGGGATAAIQPSATTAPATPAAADLTTGGGATAAIQPSATTAPAAAGSIAPGSNPAPASASVAAPGSTSSAGGAGGNPLSAAAATPPAAASSPATPASAGTAGVGGPAASAPATSTSGVGAAAGAPGTTAPATTAPPAASALAGGGVSPAGAAATPVAPMNVAPLAPVPPPAPPAAPPIAPLSAAAGAVLPAPAPVVPPTPAAVSPIAPVTPASPVAPPPAAAPMAPAAGGGTPAVAAAGGPGAAAGAPGAVAHSTASPAGGGSAPATPANVGSASRGPDSASSSPVTQVVPGDSTAPVGPGLENAGLVPLVVPPTESSSVPIAPIFNEDLEVVRSVVEAAGGAAEVSWAAAVVIANGERYLVATSDRGRGWMPATAMLPTQVVFPWSHPAASRWEGLRDPARIIVEFAAAAEGRIVALASTYPTSLPAVASEVPWVFADGTDRSHPELFSGQMATRFDLQIPASRRAEIAAITDPVEQRRQALWVAVDADTRAGRLAGRSAVLTGLSAHPGRVDEARWVSSFDWAAVEAAYRDACERERAARVDVRDVAVGAVETAGAGRAEMAQVLATEAALALRHPVAITALRDAVYAWTRLLEIPRAQPESPITPI